MNISSINSDLIRGNVTAIILKTLFKDDRYGYDILKEIENKSEGQYRIKQATLYSCLKRLEKQGYITSYWGAECDTSGGRRRYYSLSDKGKNYLIKSMTEYEYSRTILDRLLSNSVYDLLNDPAPYCINELRPFTKRGGLESESTKPQSKTQKAQPLTAQDESTTVFNQVDEVVVAIKPIINSKPSTVPIVETHKPISKEELPQIDDNTFKYLYGGGVETYSNAIADSFAKSNEEHFIIKNEQEKEYEPITYSPTNEVVDIKDALRVQRERASKMLGIGKFKD